MKRKTILTLSAAAAATVLGAIAIPAIAGARGPHDDRDMQHAMRMMHDGEAGVMRDSRGQGHWMRGGRGAMRMGGMTESSLYQSFDSDEDGTVTSAEMQAGIAALHAAHDADGNGALTPAEFASMFAEVAKGFSERPFTMLDLDEDGEISAEEMTFRALMQTRRQRMQEAAQPDQQ